MTSNKQQKTPSKEHMKGVLKDWMETVDQVGLGGRTGEDLMELQDGDVARGAESLVAWPSQLTGALDEARQEK
jgi:hypothetical protein